MPTSSLNQLVQHEAYRLVLWQLAVVLLLALGAALFNRMVGFSILMGGLAYGVPNLIFVWRVFRYSGAQQMNKFVVAFFFGEMFKLIISAILFLVIVKYLPVSLLSVLIGFISAIIAFWIVCFWHFSKPKKSRSG